MYKKKAINYYEKGLIMQQQGNLSAAEKSYRNAIRINQDFTEAHNNLGNVLLYCGRLKEAESSYRKALNLYPNHAMVLNNIGNTLQQQGKNENAIVWLNKAIAADPDYADAYSNLGNALQELGRLDEAIISYNNAIRLNPSLSEAYTNLGAVLIDLGQLQEAVEKFNKAIQLKPDYAEAYYNRGNALKDLELLHQAIENYNKAIQLKPDYAEVFNSRGNALRDLGLLDQAIESYKQAIQLKPDYAEAFNNRGNALRDLKLLDQAIENYNQAIKLKPDYAEAFNNRGNAQKNLGLQDAAMDSYNKAFKLKPDYALALRNLGSIKQYNSGDPQIELMESLYSKSESTGSDYKHLCFALAKAYEDLCEYEKSFNYLEEGNRLCKKELDYNIDDDLRLIDRIKAIFTTKSLPTNISQDMSDSIQPIFILGMPRSGTSLVEQILASQSKVYGAGELVMMGQLVRSILSDENTNNDRQKLSTAEINTVHNGYLEALAALKVPEKVITDKMPLNFRWIGFILSAFPDAKIIHLNRDPMATCWSIYKHSFSSKGNQYAYDMGDLAEFYKLYIDLMSFWHKQFPNSIYDLCYEDLTQNQEKETRRLLEFCDLEWEEQCLNFHTTKRAVNTASATQVRRKMYKGSSDAWRKYEKYLQPLINGIGY